MAVRAEGCPAVLCHAVLRWQVMYLDKKAQLTAEQLMAALLVDLKQIAEREQVRGWGCGGEREGSLTEGGMGARRGWAVVATPRRVGAGEGRVRTRAASSTLPRTASLHESPQGPAWQWQSRRAGAQRPCNMESAPNCGRADPYSPQGEAVDECVLAVPTYYTEPERHAMLDAATVAGWKCLRLMNDTTATALAYGIYKTDLPADQPIHVAFVDVGYSATQVRVVVVCGCGWVGGKVGGWGTFTRSVWVGGVVG